MTVVGIDPGINGAVVGLAMAGKAKTAFSQALKTVSLRQVVDFYANAHFCIEKIPKFVSGNDKIPLSSMCTLYGSYAYALGYLQGAGADVIEVIPQRWQKTVCGRLLRMEYLERKRWLCQFAKDLARKEFPALKITLTNCDAFLIAYYRYQQLKEKI